MQVEVVKGSSSALEAELLVVAVADGEELPESLRNAPGAADVRTGFRKVSLLHANEARVLTVGLGKREERRLRGFIPRAGKAPTSSS